MDNLFLVLGDGFIFNTSWKELGNQLYPGMNIKTRKDLNLYNLKTDLYLVLDNIHIKINNNIGKIKLIACDVISGLMVNLKNELYFYDIKEDNQLTFVKIDYNFGKIKHITCRQKFMVVNEDNEIYYFTDGPPIKIGENLVDIKQILCGQKYISVLTEKEIFVFEQKSTDELFTEDINDYFMYKHIKTNNGMFTKKLIGNSNELYELRENGELTPLYLDERDHPLHGFYKLQRKNNFIDVFLDTNWATIRKNGIVNIYGSILNVKGSYERESGESIFCINKIEMCIKSANKVVCNNNIFVLTSNGELYVISYPKIKTIDDVIDVFCSSGHAIYTKYS